MNGPGGHYGQQNQWQEHKTPDGCPYYYNSATKVTQWTKPEDMMSPAEVCAPIACYPLAHRMANMEKACACESAMEGVYRRGWAQVLVQYRNEAKLLGNARGL